MICTRLGNTERNKFAQIERPEKLARSRKQYGATEAVAWRSWLTICIESCIKVDGPSLCESLLIGSAGGHKLQFSAPHSMRLLKKRLPSSCSSRRQPVIHHGEKSLLKNSKLRGSSVGGTGYKGIQLPTRLRGPPFCISDTRRGTTALCYGRNPITVRSLSLVRVSSDPLPSITFPIRTLLVHTSSLFGGYTPIPLIQSQPLFQL